ncbi:MAG TPA: hypothetical protein VH330_07350 [Candidatus Udaeobacter sp.]|jgi:hypothetical protein
MSQMPLMPEVEFHRDIRLFVYTPRGLLNEKSVNKVVSLLGYLERKLKEPFNRFSDTSETDGVELNFRYVIRISLHRVLSYKNRPPVKSAILATDSTIAQYCRLHAVITKDSPINVRIFREREGAARWLDAPIERVRPKFPVQESANGKDE